MFKLSLLIAAALIVLSSSALANDEPKVVKIEIVGNQALSRSQITEVMETQTVGWKFWTKRPALDQSALIRDEAAIVQLYRNEGFYQAEVDIKAEEKGRRAWVTVNIEEGPPVKIRKVELGVTAFDPDQQTELTELVTKLGLVQGRIFRLEDFRQVKNGLVRYLAERAHPKPHLSAKARVSASQGWADVAFELAPGPALNMGQVRVEGLGRTKLKVILKEVPWQIGQTYDQKLLDELQRRLMDLRVFTSVRVEPLLDQIKDDQVPIQVTLVERKARSVEIGVGFGTEDKLRVRGSLSVRSVLGLAETISVGAHYSSRAWGGLANYGQPHFLRRNQDLNLQLGHIDQDEVSFSNTRSFGSAGLDRTLAGPLRLKFGYLLEINRPYDILIDEPVAQNRQFWVSALTLETVLDTRDDKLDPSQGVLLSVWTELAPRLLGSEVGYLKFGADLSRHLPVKPWLTLSGRLKAVTVSSLHPTDHLPVFKRLFAGGSRSIRGYPYHKLGPLDREGNPLGGQSLVELSLEARFPLLGPLGGVVFTEAGNISSDAWSLDMGQFQYTVGVGLRFKTLIGPLRLDMGYQLNPPPEADFSRFQVHFNIGQAF